MSEQTETINPDEWRTITGEALATCDGRRLEALTEAATGGIGYRAFTRNSAHFMVLYYDAVRRFHYVLVTGVINSGGALVFEASIRVGSDFIRFTGDTPGEALCRAYIAAAQKEAAHAS